MTGNRVDIFDPDILITNIQRFCLHDGPGIRTTIFLKSCSLRCPWCSNPENLDNKIQKYIKDGVMGNYGKFYTTDEIYEEVIKDKIFYVGEVTDIRNENSNLLDRLPGGITFSGGEALLQIKKLKPLLEKLNKEHVHTVIETSLFASEDNLKIAMQYIDLFYVDIKILDEKLCKKHLHGNLKHYLSNLNILMKSYKPVVIRIPVIGGYTDDIENRRSIYKILSKYSDNILKVELIKEHNLGINKYKSLVDAGNNEINIPNYKGVSDDLIEKYKKEIEQLGIWTEICKI